MKQSTTYLRILAAACCFLLAAPSLSWPARYQDPAGDHQDSAKSDEQDENVNEASADAASPPASKSVAASRRESPLVKISRESRAFLDVFQPIVERSVQATVKVKKGKGLLALGAIVDANGFVLTKQSELRSPLTVELSDGRSFPANVYGIHEATDLALLKIDAEKLPTIRFSNIQSPEIGTWLATVSTEDQPLAVGVVGVKARRIRPPRGFMGVNLGAREQQVFIREVTQDTPAERAGVKSGDVILQVNDTAISSIVQVQEVVGNFPPGEQIRMTVERDGKKVVLDITLGNAETLNPQFERSNQQNRMGSTLSRRRSDFPLAVQHDTALQSTQCGGPVVDIDGDVVGINIARKGRVSSLMLPVSVVAPAVDELKSGLLAPALVYKERIDEINRALENLASTLNLAPLEYKEMREKLKQLTTTEDAAKKKHDEALEELLDSRDETAVLRTRLEELDKKLQTAKREKERLERELEKLVTGVR